jgi:gas vesicle protein
MDTYMQAPAQLVLGQHIGAFVLGAAVGATVATLYAVRSGADTRARIVGSANQFKDQATQCMDQASEMATGIRDKTVSIVHDTLDRAAGALQSASDYTAMAK